ncbi:hypothetical protein J0H58_19470 [bacterium]|nr:hypothetical protein [bacterium]
MPSRLRVGAQLAQVRTQVQAASQRQQEVFERTGGRGPAFQAAADEVVRLTTRASNLQQALKRLADVSQRQVTIQEKLNRLKEEEDGRLGLAERYATASPEELARLDRGFVMANQAAQVGNLDGFSNDDRRLIVDTLRSAGGITLTGFNGSPRADDLLRNLLGNSFGGAFRLTQAQQAERRGLQGETLNRNGVGEEAIQQLIQHQQQGSADFFRNLQEQQNQFFSRLERTLLQIRVQDVQNERARASARVNEIQGRESARSLLNGVGVTTTPQLEVLRGKAPQVEELRQAIAAQTAERGRVTAAVRGVGSFTAFGGGGKNISEFLAGSGLSDDQTRRVNTRYEELRNSRDFGIQRDALFRRLGQSGLNGPELRARQDAGLDDIARRFLTQALREEGARDNGGRVREALTPFQGIQGLNTGALVQMLNGPNADAFVRALNQFDSSGNRLEDFGRHLSDATQRVADLDAQLRNLNAQLNPTANPRPDAAGTVTRAGGGDIFRPMGTDTVPAMLTPGEFVVNAKSAAANAALLHEINSAKGAVQYRQTGGPIIRTAQQNAPSTSQVANGYLWTVDKIRAGMGWLGFSNGGRVPQYLADGGSALGTFVAYNTAPPQDPQVRRREEQRRRMAEGARDRAANNTNTVGGNTATISAIPDDFARAFAEQARSDARRKARAQAGERAAQARAERKRQRGLDAAGNAAFAAQAANFNRAAFLTGGIRRPGDEGQRAIAARSLEAQNKTFEKAYQQDGQLREFLASRVSSQLVRTRPFAFGGMVPGTGSTDTVPALLTRGEAVLNTRAVNQLGANAIQRFNQGGLVGNVQYRAEGGSVQGGGGNTDQLAAALSLFSQATNGFVSSAQQMAQTFNVFAGQAQALSQAMSSFPRVLSGQFSHQVTVVHNGAEVFAKLTPFVEQLVTDRVNTVLTRTFQEHMPEAGIVLS